MAGVAPVPTTGTGATGPAHSGGPPGPVAAEGPALSGSAPRVYTPAHLVERILTTRAALEGERKNVTVLFADVADYTGLAERVDAEEIHGLMDRCFQVLLERVHAWEGTVNQFTGDGVMALFGAPVALEEGPRRAVYAALEIQAALQALCEEVRARFEREFRMRIGIHNGPVVVGRIGDDLRMDYTAVGDTTNLAARLQQNAAPGEVLVSEAVKKQVEGFVHLEGLGPLTVKGRRQPVDVFRVTGKRAVTGRIEADSLRGLTPMVGRARELRALEDAFASAQRGEGRVVFVVGEAGIGKSRLVHEFHRRMGEESAIWVRGRSLSYGRSSPFHTIANCVRNQIGIEEGDAEEVALAKVEESVAEIGDDLKWTTPFLRCLVGLPSGDPAVDGMDAATRRSEITRALQARFLRLTERKPFVVVIEDLHWIDQASEEFLVYLADSVPATRSLLVLTHRPGYEQRFGDRSYHLRVSLQPVAEEEAATLAALVCSDCSLPEELTRLIVRKSEGNPLFVEELVRAIVESGALEAEDGNAGDAAGLVIPNRIHDVLMARLDRLEDEPKQVLQVASVIGREFSHRLLERVAVGGEALERSLHRLRALELIYEKTAFPDPVYVFKHALTQDVTYASILVQRRKTLHGTVAAAIEDVYRDRPLDQYESLARHFALAEQWDSAIRYHGLAGDKAVAAWANQAAVEHYRQALELSRGLGEAIPATVKYRLAHQLARACSAVNRYREAGDAFLEAVEFADTPARRALEAGEAANAFHWGHEYARSRETLVVARRLAREADSKEAEAVAVMVEGFTAATSHGDVRRFRRATEKGMALAEESPTVTAFSCLNMAIASEWTGDYRTTLESLDRAIPVFRRTGRPDLLNMAAWFRAKALCCLGRYREAFELLEGALTSSRRMGSRGTTARVLNTLGWCYAEVGAYQRAAECNRSAWDLGAELVAEGTLPQAREIYANSGVNLVSNYLALGEMQAVEEKFEEVRAVVERPGDPWQRWRYKPHLDDLEANILLPSGSPERALELAELECEQARESGARKIEARALEMGARALLAMDQREQAGERAAEALQIAREIGYPPVVYRVLALQAERARRDGRDGEARSRENEARALVRTLAEGLGEAEVRADLQRLGERCVSDPYGKLC